MDDTDPAAPADEVREHGPPSSLPDPAFAEVLESAAQLQRLIPDAVLVGGSAAAFYVHHRLSFDHDHVLSRLQEQFDAVLEAVEAEGDWVTNRVTYGKIILGSIGGIEAGVRQLIRRTPLEVAEVELPSGAVLRVPTIDETLRIKAFLAVKRNQVRDYLDIAALSDRVGLEHAADVLSAMDQYYADQHAAGEGVSSQVARQLAEPRPRDSSVIGQLDSYKGLRPEWQQWSRVVGVCQDVASLMVEKAGP